MCGITRLANTRSLLCAGYPSTLHPLCTGAMNQPRSLERVGPKFPICKLAPLALAGKRACPTIAAPSAAAIRRVVLALCIGRWVDEEGFPVDFDFRSAARRAERRKGLVKVVLWVYARVHICMCMFIYISISMCVYVYMNYV